MLTDDKSFEFNIHWLFFLVSPPGKIPEMFLRSIHTCVHAHTSTHVRPDLFSHVGFSSQATMHHGAGGSGGVSQGWWPTRANKEQPSTPTVTTQKHLVESD